VFVAANGRAQKRVLQIALRSGLSAKGEKGLQPSEKVVIFSGDAIKDGKAIKPVP
jgi:hypothetical protein